MNSEELLNIAVTATEDKKAEDIVSLNMQGISAVSYTHLTLPTILRV